MKVIMWWKMGQSKQTNSHIILHSSYQIISVRELGEASYLYQLIFLSPSFNVSFLCPLVIIDVFNS